MPKFSPKSEKLLATCHPDIQRVMRKVIKVIDFTVTCGLRGEKAQNELYPKFTKVKFPKSKHNRSLRDDGTWDYTVSDAIDIAPYPINWDDKEMFRLLAKCVLEIAEEEGVKLAWGGHWKRFKDMPHFERVTVGG